MNKTRLIQVKVDKANQSFIKKVEPIAKLNGYEYKPERVN